MDSDVTIATDLTARPEGALLLRLSQDLLYEEDPQSLARLLEEHGANCIVEAPMPSIGTAGSHLPIGDDYLNAAFIGETLHQYCTEIEAEETVVKTCYLTIHFMCNVRDISGFVHSLLLLIRAFDPIDEDENANELDDVFEELADFRDRIPEETLRFPHLIDSYLLNWTIGQGYENIGSDDPADWEPFFPENPEAPFGFVTSNLSPSVGGKCLLGTNAIAVEQHVDLDIVLESNWGISKANTGPRTEATYLDMEEHSRYYTNQVVVVRVDWNPVAQCLEMLDQGLPTISSRVTTMSMPLDGSYFVVNTGGWRVIVFSDKVTVLPAVAVESLLGKLEQKVDLVRDVLGKPTNVSLPWGLLTDESFERLCCDILATQSRFRPSTLRKMGKSRSRDGGRDIQVMSSRRLSAPEGKWIFQCKAINPSSALAGSHVSMSDTIDQYGAQGYGVMTSGIIDATLWDKIDAITQNRGIGSDVWDVLRLERFLSTHKEIRDRYFRI